MREISDDSAGAQINGNISDDCSGAQINGGNF